MSLVFPAPTIVIGVGRFGLAILERLGDDWLGLRVAGADPSLQNLRLLAVRPGSEADERQWCEHEKGVVSVARYLGEGDLPWLALDLVILRSLGLVRYRDGSYQVATPRDAGVVEIWREESEPPVRQLLRRRYFEWTRLSPDPIVAAERLRYLVQRLKELDVFVTPLLNRVKQGHSPQALLACIGRCRALQEGRDPAPWGWLRHADVEVSGDFLRVDQAVEEQLSRGDAKAAESHLAAVPAPLPAWSQWLDLSSDSRPHLDLFIPEPLRPRESDLPAPLDPSSLLGRDWETTGWASTAGEPGAVVFDLLPVSPFRLGLFDHDDRETRPGNQETELPHRLRLLAEHLHRGLVRLWVDLQWERVAELDVNVLVQARQRDYLSDALQQSLEILGELVVRPLSRPGDEAREAPIPPAPERKASDPELELPLAPSRFLASLVLTGEDEDSSASAVLSKRLARLGLEDSGNSEPQRYKLLEDVPLLPEAHRSSDGLPGLGDDDGGALPAELRRALNHQVRQLFGFSLLSKYRNRPTRRPPRLTVFVIGDMSEPFTRETLRPVLREVHAELLRAFTPIFETYREGFDRCLCVTPILWTPHPADPFPGEELVLNRCEEAAIIDGIHGIRRWVECVLPPGRRCISQIFVNSRVTDTASLSLSDAVRQTRDFLAFQTRSDLSSDLWLRQTSVSAGGSDLFSSFSCYEIDFPALRSREYLANRLARECLAEIKEGPEVRIEPPEPFAPPPVARLVTPAREVLSALTREAADAMAQRVTERRMPDETTPAQEIAATFDEQFERSLYGQIQDRWSELTGRQGRVDDMVDDLRLKTSRLLSKELERVRQHSDRLIEDYVGAGGLKAAQAGFHLLRAGTRDTFQREEELRRHKETLSLHHQIPAMSPVSQARLRVLRTAERKPDLGSLRLGLLLWGLLCPVLGAPLAFAIAYFFELQRHPGVFDLLLGPAAPLVGGATLFAPAWALAHWHIRRRSMDVREAIDKMAAAVRRLLWGSGLPPDQEAQPSVRSFLESRLELTGAVATRGFALRVLERAVADSKLAYRLNRSVDIQLQALSRRSEDLGVRSRMADSADRQEDVRKLFDSRAGGAGDRLIDPQDLEDYYAKRVGRREDLPDRMRDLIEAAGGFADWRERACLAESERILRYCRGQFEPIVSEPISEQHFFAEKAGQRLVRFVTRCYSNLGFGAGFKGYEGLDPDNVQVLADASLVVHPGFATVFQKAREVTRHEMPTTETMQVITAGIRPNAAYMLSLVQGIRVHSMRNLRRFESFHNRVTLPDDRIFPLSHEQQSLGSPINPLTGYKDVARALSDGVRYSEQPEPVDGTP
ncbi:MAG TPA: hypothetical protein VLB76_19410 [Thermoanaerobaculia bacterium]|nr:hypothetical protein [Thermoanaerobaculia bacterium]